MPALDRQEIILPLSLEILEEYNQIVNDIKATHKQRYVNTKSSFSNPNPNALEMLHRLRQFTSISKTYTTAQFVGNKLKNTQNSSIVVFVWFRETANELKNQIEMSEAEIEGIEAMSVMSKVDSFNCEILSGECSAEKRQNLVDSFQKGLIKVLICTFGKLILILLIIIIIIIIIVIMICFNMIYFLGVGSTGITLTKSNTVILLGIQLLFYFYLFIEIQLIEIQSSNMLSYFIIDESLKLNVFIFYHTSTSTSTTTRSTMDSRRCVTG